MTILGNIHDGDKGRSVRALATARKARVGSGASLELTEIYEGTLGVVTDVESHGASPFTRYAVRFSDGTWQNGLVYGTDFTFSDGEPQTDRTRPARTHDAGADLDAKRRIAGLARQIRETADEMGGAAAVGEWAEAEAAAESLATLVRLAQAVIA